MVTRLSLDLEAQTTGLDLGLVRADLESISVTWLFQNFQ